MMTRRKRAKTVTIHSLGMGAPFSRWFGFRSSSPSAFFKSVLVLLCILSATGLGLGAPKNKHAEKPYALIYGTVWGPDSRPVYGVRVKIRRADQKKPKWEVYSDHQGEFAQRVPAGQAEYVIIPDLKGLKTVSGRPLRLAREVTVHVTYDEREDVGLHLTY